MTLTAYGEYSYRVIRRRWRRIAAAVSPCVARPALMAGRQCTGIDVVFEPKLRFRIDCVYTDFQSHRVRYHRSISGGVQ